MELIDKLEDLIALEALNFPVRNFQKNGKMDHKSFYGVEKDFRQDAKNLYFIHYAIEKHGRRYGYRDVEYLGADQQVRIHCSRHGVFKQMARIHLRGAGCKRCRFDPAKPSIDN